jgi:hypothetical protein
MYFTVTPPAIFAVAGIVSLSTTFQVSLDLETPKDRGIPRVLPVSGVPDSSAIPPPQTI